jgi:hypothetical protein
MALPIQSTITTAIQNIYLAITNVKSHYESPRMSQALDEVISGISVLYSTFVVTVPAAQATLSPFFLGALVTAKQAASVYGAASTSLPQVSLQIGDVFSVTSAVDTTNTALATAKGSAPVANDNFQITNKTVGSEAVTFLGNGALALTAYNYDTFKS